jgi:hypothetical protein
LFGKFVIEHPDLKEPIKNDNNNIHHPKYLYNFFEYFKNEKRALSFINLSFDGIWWIFIFTFLAILLNKHNLSSEKI